MTPSLGDCFEVALKNALEDHSLTVVHGRPIGTGQHNLGRRYWHAWNERTDTLEFPNLPPTHITFVIDKSNGNDVCLPAGMYYNLGRIDPNTVHRYTFTEAAEEALATGHYGPWKETK